MLEGELVFTGEDGGDGRQIVLYGIARNVRLSFCGLRSREVLRVFAVSGELSLRCHGQYLRVNVGYLVNPD